MQRTAQQAAIVSAPCVDGWVPGSHYAYAFVSGAERDRVAEAFRRAAGLDGMASGRRAARKA